MTFFSLLWTAGGFSEAPLINAGSTGRSGDSGGGGSRGGGGGRGGRVGSHPMSPAAKSFVRTQPPLKNTTAPTPRRTPQQQRETRQPFKGELFCIDFFCIDFFRCCCFWLQKKKIERTLRKHWRPFFFSGIFCFAMTNDRGKPLSFFFFFLIVDVEI